MRKYLLHVLIISFVFLLVPTACINRKVEEHFNLGNAYYESGKWKEAIESYKQAIRIDPIGVYGAFAHFNLGLTYIQINDRGSAMEQYKILKKLDTELANKLFNAIYE